MDSAVRKLRQIYKIFQKRSYRTEKNILKLKKKSFQK